MRELVVSVRDEMRELEPKMRELEPEKRVRADVCVREREHWELEMRMEFEMRLSKKERLPQWTWLGETWLLVGMWLGSESGLVFIWPESGKNCSGGSSSAAVAVKRVVVMAMKNYCGDSNM
ncbi:hypothetical protein F2Q70_00036643 [Brassica cretica]|uniref:Uncharacterized protein n=1 Tax=Brassica cretica TaxID=69181 RepID=A0A8S9JZW9_BRACR|nr:hypothetical protein F2Q70_00036643 [Brassica cretica]